MSQSSGEKTEKPTSKRIRDSRKKGQVAKSRDLSSALILLSITITLWFESGTIVGEIQLLFRKLIEKAFVHHDKTGPSSFSTSGLNEVFYVVLLIVAPVLMVAFLTAIVTNYLQIGSLFSTESLKFNFSKLNFASNFKQKFFKSRTYLEFIKSLIKIIALIIVCLNFLLSSKDKIINLPFLNKSDAIWIFTGRLLFGLGLRASAVFLVFGTLDYLLQKYLHRRELMMTKQEVREDYKTTQGNPLIKSRRKSLHREILRENMPTAVKNSTVVITNPTHISIALSYDKSGDEAPVVVAKGVDHMALQIKLIALQNDIPVRENVPLARALYKTEVDDTISEELYESVALIIDWVYKLQNMK